MTLMTKIFSYAVKRGIRGAGYISKSLYKKGLIVENKYGVKLFLDPYEKIDSEIIKKGYFDDLVLIEILKYIKNDDVFWDIGANFGLHSLTLKKICQSVTCFCFEPYYIAFDKLVDNLSINPSLKLNVFNLGLTSSHKVMNFYLTPGNLGRTSFKKLPGSYETKIFTVLQKGDDLVKFGIKTPNVIKIDAEGLELDILLGLENILANNVLRAIIFETFDQYLEIEVLLKNNGFFIKSIDQGSNYVALRQ
jgi:FkbM family methyltransferase